MDTEFYIETVLVRPERFFPEMFYISPVTADMLPRPLSGETRDISGVWVKNPQEFCMPVKYTKIGDWVLAVAGFRFGTGSLACYDEYCQFRIPWDECWWPTILNMEISRNTLEDTVAFLQKIGLTRHLPAQFRNASLNYRLLTLD
ncbi:hypothetical protein ACJU26_08670 [Acidithiobacillus sp. M4-SHS-6]|uniref:hypothetical protein n=1 Tax=Acidithiobacillus sp. M4-SHS-6 TaxID=3383024 RepID=UPI0039BE2621